MHFLRYTLLTTLTNYMDYKNIIETILLACEQPISNNLIRTALKVDLSNSDIEDIINVLNDEYKKNQKGIYIAFISEAYQIRTLPEFHEYISIIQNNSKQYKLSNAGLEVLSIIAFKQPIARLDIEAILFDENNEVLSQSRISRKVTWGGLYTINAGDRAFDKVAKSLLEEIL